MENIIIKNLNNILCKKKNNKKIKSEIFLIFRHNFQIVYI